MRSKILLLGVFVALLAAAPAYAHTGANAVFSFSSGFLHPLGGLDHLLAMFEMPGGGEVLAYVAGFAVATALIHAAGIGFALVTKDVSARMAATAVSAAGLAFLLN